MKQLLVDVGNSSIKWCWVSGTDLLECDRCLNRPDIYQKSLRALIRQRKPEAVLISSVLVPDANAALSKFLIESGFRGLRWFLKAGDTNATLTTHYPDPDTLGVDRYLAMLAAYAQEKKSVIVVDVGTATTVDYISSNGSHLGGVILPGHAMMAHAFSQKIPRLGTIEWARDVSQLNPFQTTTRGGMNHGLRYAWVGGITKVLSDITRDAPEKPSLFLTGGDAELLGDLLAVDAQIDKHLVLKGLALQLEKP